MLLEKGEIALKAAKEQLYYLFFSSFFLKTIINHLKFSLKNKKNNKLRAYRLVLLPAISTLFFSYGLCMISHVNITRN